MIHLPISKYKDFFHSEVIYVILLVTWHAVFPTLTFLTNFHAHFGIERRHNWQHWLVGTLWSKSWKKTHCLLLCTFYWINKLFIIDALQRKRMHHYKTKYSKKITKAFMKINLWITIKDFNLPYLTHESCKKISWI